MTELILGMLLQQKLTVYEIRSLIRKRFLSFCTDSLGSIQAVLKKLLAEDKVVFHEYVEKSVNKKRYSITDKGREHFFKWLQNPIDITDVRNTETGKLLLFGMLSEEERISVIDDTIALLEEEVDYLLEVRAYDNSIRDDETMQLHEHWSSDTNYFSFVMDKAEEIMFFKNMTLEYGLELLKFNIEWFKHLKKIIKRE